MSEPTPGQTIGPFFAFGLDYPGGPDLVRPGHPDVIRLHGQVFDGDGAPVPDALIEIGQTGPDGALVRRPGSLHRDGWTFTGWGRAATDNAGQYSFSTLRPGGPSPFFSVTVFARGLLDRLVTRAYLPSREPDALLSRVPEDRRHTLIALAEPDGLRFDVHLQGQDETVFLDFSPVRP